MPNFRLKDGVLGGLSAESDPLLQDAFIDTGARGTILDTNSPRFLVLGRTGSGKTALFKSIENEPNMGRLDPDALSMQYLHNSTLLPSLVAAGINLDVFYKYLWKHVCVLELIRIRYGSQEDVPSTLARIFDFGSIGIGKEAKRRRQRAKQEQATKDSARKYLVEYADEYWVKADTRIRKITSELESRLTADEEISAGLKGIVDASVGTSAMGRRAVRLEREVVDRAQSIVSDFLLADLNQLVKLLGAHAFNDDQSPYFVLVDDLDKDWMPNDGMYIGLMKGLLTTVRDLNFRLPGAKVIVALRDNVYRHVFANTSSLEPQREKWLDLTLSVSWSRDQLGDLVDRRLAVITRGQYTKAPAKLADLLPQRVSGGPTARKYLFGRTLERPRDVLDFLNECVKAAGDLKQLTWDDIRTAERTYSLRRLAALDEEWRNTYDGVRATAGFLADTLGKEWDASEMTDDRLDELLGRAFVENYQWLSELRDRILAGEIHRDVCCDLLVGLADAGLLAIRLKRNRRVIDLSDPLQSLSPSTLDEYLFAIHPMFWSAVGLAA